jgi:4-nitrophenyl phosphatase
MTEPFLANPAPPSNVVFDLDGVIFLGGEAIAGSGAALHELDARGINVLFATNNATRTIDYIVERITALTGFAPSPRSVTTSATSAADALGPADDPVFVVGEAGLTATLADANRSTTLDAGEAQTVVVGLDRQISYEKLEHASTAIRNGARFVATNTDVTFPTPSGPVPGAGTIVAAVAAASGRDPEIMGKPHPAMVEHVSRLLVPGDTWMIGDRPETDIAFAKAAGWAAVLTLSGIVTNPTDVAADLQPDLVIDSIADLINAIG